MNTIKQMNSLPRDQQGATLFVALILLVLISLIGIGTLKSASVAEKMSSSDYQKNITFQQSESAVSLARQTAANHYDAITNGSKTIPETDVDNIKTNVDYNYAGYGPMPGWSILNAHRVTVTSVVTTNGSNTTTVHGIMVPKLKAE